MEHVWIHEYFRIFLPGIFFAGLIKLLFPAHLPSDSGQLLLLSAFVGLVSTPFTDKLAKKYFDRQILKTEFYERFIRDFLTFYNISTEKGEGAELVSFSGKLKMEASPQAQCALEAYKIFSRQGWGNEEEKNRVRIEKSFGILYFSLFCFSFLGALICVGSRIGKVAANTITGKWYVDALLFLVLMLITHWEAIARFRMSLDNEMLILVSHFKELKASYDGLTPMFQRVASKGRSTNELDTNTRK